MISSPAQRHGIARSGSALIVVLCFVVLATVVILAFFAETARIFQISDSGPTRSTLDALSESAVATTIADLRLEMLAGAEPVDTTDFSQLPLMQVRNRHAMVPARVVSSNLPDTGFQNLVKQSLTNTAFYPGASPAATYRAQGPAGNTGTERASSVNTGSTSPNGRRLSPRRWNAVSIAPSSFPANALPDWIYTTRSGIPATAPSPGNNLSDHSIGNAGFVTGRYSYHIYNVGGLLNANAVGAPLSGDSIWKGSLAWADLATLGLRSDEATELIGFRSYHSKELPLIGDFFRTQAERTGFIAPLEVNIPGSGSRYDSFFHTRGDLIRYFVQLFGRASVQDLSPDERLILSRFSDNPRFSTAPSWTPDPTRPRIVRADAGGNDSYGQDDQINPAVTGLRIPSDAYFHRLLPDANGNLTRNVPAKKGEPLLIRRFPLSRLRLITRHAIASAGSPIERSFGLTRTTATSPWIYGQGEQGRILTLEEVLQRTPPREPNMVELLKAAIVAGSLGKSAGPNTESNTETTAGGSVANARDQRLDYQIIQIFANLIDQYDADGFPTEILFYEPDPEDPTMDLSTSFYGVENLPYLTRIKTYLMRMLPDSTAEAPDQPYRFNFLPEIWNPHDSLNLPATADSPSQIRVVADTRPPGYPIPWLYEYGAEYGNTFTARGSTGFSPDANHIQLTAAELAAREPVMIRRGFPTTVATAPVPTGLSGPEFIMPGLDPALAPAQIYFEYRNNSATPGVTFGLEYLDPDSGDWRRYFSRYIRRAGYATRGWDNNRRGRSSPADYVRQNNSRTLSADPRTDRFSSLRVMERENMANAYGDGQPLRSGKGTGKGFLTNASNPFRPSSGYGWTIGLTNEASTGDIYALGTILQNTAASATRYVDPDGVLRPGDGALSGSGLEGEMYQTGNFPSRPIVLNRPFRSVAELGYAFRGTPARSLDFFSAESGDAPLLDFFSVSETPDDGVSAGRIAINSASVEALASLLKGTVELDTGTSGTLLADARALQAAESIVAHIQTKGPLLNRAELVTYWLGDANAFPIGILDDERIKRRREVYARALGDVIETRTWNLLIDLIVQSGRIPNGKTQLEEFVVGSERHLWVHLSIDRFTGEILSIRQELAHE